MKQVWDTIWAVIKVVPAVVLKTTTGRYLLALAIVALVKSFYDGITVADVVEILVAIAGTLYGNETKSDLKKFYD